MISVVTGGYNLRHPNNFQMRWPDGIPYYLLLIVKSNAEFYIDGRFFTVEPHTAVIISPFTPYQYTNPEGEYSDDYLRFTCTEKYDLTLLKSLQLNEPFPIGASTRYTIYIQQILWEHHYLVDQYRLTNENLLLNALFNNLIAAYTEKNMTLQSHPHYENFMNLRIEMQSASDRDYNINNLADRMNISTSHFQHLYKRFFNVAFRTDLIKARIEHAKFILSTTDFTVESISETCGYTNVIHFYRQFKKITGVTPSEFREYSPVIYNEEEAEKHR